MQMAKEEKEKRKEREEEDQKQREAAARARMMEVRPVVALGVDIDVDTFRVWTRETDFVLFVCSLNCNCTRIEGGGSVHARGCGGG